MLAHKCKQCRCITTKGYINEFDEHFCRESCYKKYCNIHNYEIHLERLKEVVLR